MCALDFGRRDLLAWRQQFGLGPNHSGAADSVAVGRVGRHRWRQEITVHDRATPFEIRNESGAAVRDLTNVYQLSVLL